MNIYEAPLLSVIIPCYNVAQYLRQCLDSVFKQNYANTEVICVDDGSTDQTYSILCEYAERHSNLVLVSQANAGQSAARNAALDIIKGEYVTFIDADDYYEGPNIFSNIIKVLETDPSCDIVSYPTSRGSHAEAPFIEYDRVEKYRRWLRYPRTITNYLWDKIFRARLFDGIRLPIDRVFEDRYIFPHLLDRCRGFKHINTDRYYYRVNPTSTTKNINHKYRLNNIAADLHILPFIPTSLKREYAMMVHHCIVNSEAEGYLCHHEIVKALPKLRLMSILFSPRVPVGLKLAIPRFIFHKSGKSETL
jgi:glycosyltransferase, group 2 family